MEFGTVEDRGGRAVTPLHGKGGLTFGSLFSGVGGADLGLEKAGMRCLWHCEFDRAASDVLRYRWPDVPNYGDVRTFPFDDCEVPDVLWMSPPCQDLSVAGKRAGLAGERSGLFYDAIRIAVRLRDRGLRWVLMEQVPGLFSSNGGEDVRQALHELCDLGVSVAWRVLDSQWFGVPQRRRRAYFVVDLGAERAGEVLALAQGLRGDPAPRRETREAVAASLTAGSHPGSNAPGRRREDDEIIAVCGTLRNHPRPGSNSLGAVAVSPCLRAQGNSSHRADTEAFIPIAIQERAVSERVDAGPQGKGWQEGIGYTLEARHHVQAVAHTLRGDGYDASEDGTGRGTPIVPCIGLDADYNGNPELLNAMKANGQGAIRNGAVAFGLATSVTPKFAEELQPTLTVPSSSGGGQPPATSYGMAVRRLMPIECERLQGWPDDHTRFGTTAAGKVYEQADGPRYKQAGNGVTANVSAWIGANLIQAESGGKE
jgi:DNA (cytosine-5)-methyltransferase 1